MSKKEIFLPLALMSIASLALSGCVSTHMKTFIGKDIREVMLTEGLPMNAFDLSDGRRAFQYKFGGGVFTAPQVSNTTTSATGVGNSVWLDQRTITQPAAILDSPGCLISYIAEFTPSKSSWIVIDIRYPKQLVC